MIYCRQNNIKSNCDAKREDFMYKCDKIETSEYELSYVCDEVEGECVLLAVLPVRLNKFKYVLYGVFSLLTVGLLPLLTYW